MPGVRRANMLDFMLASLLSLAANPVLLNACLDDKKELARHQGKWKLESCVQNGKESTSENKGMIREVRADIVTITLGKASEKSKIEIDVGANPAHIDEEMVENIEGVKPKKPIQVKGIYRFDDNDTLIICRGRPFGPRPAKFESETGTRNSLWVWKRLKP